MVATGVYLAAITEVLNLFQAVSAAGVFGFWVAGCAVLLMTLVVGNRPAPMLERFGPPYKRDPFSILLLFLIGFNASLLALIAFVGVPNTYDSMTYHLARVAHWLQNHSVSVFGTSCMYQNQHSPWAEWAQLHLVLLQGTDRWVNFVQWFSYMGSLVAVSLMAESMGGSSRSAHIAAFLAAIIPMAILQASTTQNDAVAGFWLLCFVYGCLKAAQAPSWPVILFCGASLGLALLTKATVYLLAPAFCLWLGILLLQRGLPLAVPRLALIGLAVFLLNGGYWFRNWAGTGTLLGLDRDSGAGVSYENDIHTPSAFVSNILTNLSLEAPQLPGVSPAMRKVVEKLDAWMGISPSDTRIMTYAAHYYIPEDPDETECASPIHLLLLIFSLGLLFLPGRSFSSQLRGLAACLVAGALLFCLVLKWQPFNARLHLGFFLLGVPVIAVVFEKMQYRRLLLLALGLAWVEALPLLLDSVNHPLLGHKSILTTPPSVQRFAFRPEASAEYEEALRQIRRRHPNCVGVIGPDNNSGWEYPLFDPDHMNGGYPWRVEQVGIRNCYASLETTRVPDVLVVLWPSDQVSITLHGRTYHRQFKGIAIAFYLP
jgi:4-amino-4-deoxy-L-arabinose transferase-like glycosyltransferase